MSIFTYQTRIRTDKEQDALLSAHSMIWNKAKHKLRADIMKGKKPNDLKSKYINDLSISGVFILKRVFILNTLGRESRRRDSEN